MSFTKLINENFLFLEKEYRFSLTVDNDSSVTFKRADFSILMGWYKGEIDIDFYVHLETPILRPYHSRMFRLYQVIRLKNKAALANAPQFPSYITTEEEAEQEIKFAAKLMKHHCVNILNGDIKIFEDIIQGNQHFGKSSG